MIRVPRVHDILRHRLGQLQASLEGLRPPSGYVEGARTMRMRISFLEKSFANSFVKVSPCISQKRTPPGPSANSAGRLD